MLMEFVLGSTPDISAYAMFNWYQLVWYHEPEAQFPYEKKVMGRWIGTSDSCMDLMAYSIVTQSGRVHHAEVHVGCNRRGVVD